MKDKVIICDIDSTICDHWKRIRRNTKPQWPGGTISNTAFSSREVLQDKLLPLCHEVLWKLDNLGFYITYLTARGWDKDMSVTREQLYSWDLPNHTETRVVHNMHDKIHVIPLVANVRYYIDDFMTGQENNIGTFHHGIAKAIQSLGIKVIVFRNDWLDVLEQIRHYEEK